MSRMHDILGAVSPAAASIAKPENAGPPLTHTLVPGVAAGIAGLTLWKEHRVLGFLGGEALGLNAYRLYRGQGNDRPRALCNVASSATGIAGSLMYKKHPFWGWVIGFAAGTIATGFVKGSNAYKLLHSKEGE